MLSWRKEREGGQPSLPAVLVDEGLVTEAQVEEALKKAETDGTFLGQALVEMGLIRQNDLITCLVKKCKIPHLSLLDYDVGEDLVNLVSKETCQQFHLVPIDKLGKILTVAMVDPLNDAALEAVRAACPDLRIKPILCDWEHYKSVTRRLFDSGAATPSNTVSMASLGLGAAAAPRPPAPKKEEPAAAPQQAAQPAVAPSNPAPAAPAGPSISAADIAAAVRSGLQESVQAIVAELRRPQETAPPPASAPAPAFDEAKLAAILQESMAGLVDRMPAAAPPSVIDETKLAAALQQGMRSIFEEALSRAAAAASPGAAPIPMPPAPPPIDEAKLAAALQQAMRGVVETLQPHPPAIDEAKLAAAVQQGLRDPLESALAALAERMRAAQPAEARQAAPSPAEMVDALIAALSPTTEAMRLAVDSVQQALAQGGATAASSQADLAESVTRIMQAAEAAVEATHAAKALRQATAEDAEREHEEKKSRFNSVQPFGARKEENDPDRIVLSMLDADAPLEGFSFDTFAAGKANAFAVKACHAIAKNPGAEHNPFFLYGPVGIGKTHLINAVGNAVYAQGNRRVGYVSAGRFAQRLMEARQHHAEDYFREAYSHWDVLILDDIQFLGGQIEAQEEFFHIFNALYGAGRQIIIAADKAPDALGRLEARLVSRFDGGLVAGLEPPDYSARIAILKRHCDMAKAKLPEDVLAVIATRIPNDIRKLLGALRKVIAFGGLVGEDITSDMVLNILNHVGAAEAAQ